MNHTSASNLHSVTTSITINATKADVWAVLADFDDVYQWAPGVTQSNGIGKQELGVGHGRHCEIKGFGGIDEFITQWDVENGLEYSVTPVGPLRDGLSRWALQNVGKDQTRLSITLSYNLRFGVIGRLMHALMVKAKLEKSLPGTAVAVKKRVEAKGVAAPSAVAMAS